MSYLDDDACRCWPALDHPFRCATPRPSPPPIWRYLLARSEGTIGELTMLLTEAAVAAVDSGEEAINQHTLTLAAYTGPTERRRQFERELT